MANFLFAGDIYVSKEKSKEVILHQSIVELFDSADYSIANLEAPLTDFKKENKIVKTGPHLFADKHFVLESLNRLNVDLVSLANNHIMDFGINGLNDTINLLKGVGIGHVGVGENIIDASKPISICIKGVRVGVVNIAENEWSIAEKYKAGANGLDIIDNVRQIRNAKETNDKVIVIIHGGNEYYPLPSPRMVKQYRFFADNGADIIIGHHPHCISGFEVYKKVPIFYSIGNFLFTTKKTKNEDWYIGLVLKTSIEKHKEVSFEIIPVKYYLNNQTLVVLHGSDKGQILKKVSELSNIIVSDVLLNKNWDDFVSLRREAYLRQISPLKGIKSDFLRSVLMKLGFHKMLVNRGYAKELLNRIRCEAHRDVTIDLLDKLIK